MSETLRCQRGHEWQAAVDGSLACPTCALQALTGAWPEEASESRTDRSTVPEAFAEPTVPTPDIPGYDIHGVLGRGGMGIVYKARQRKLERLVALKMVLGGRRFDPTALRRFAEEAKVLGSLQHANIVPIYDIGEHEGDPWFAMEFVGGGSLARKLGNAPQAGRSAAELVETLARAMHAVHEKGIVHRDLKPHNVLLSGSNETPLDQCVPKITDFGLAKRIEGAESVTSTGAVLGTPSYMAPEQAMGSMGKVEPRTDVYALGAILYESLTGRPPFVADTPMDTVLQVLNEEPAAPRTLNPKIARDLETICLKAMAKRPAQRYVTAGDLADDLKRWLAGEPIVARPTRRLERLMRWAARKPSLAAVCILLPLLLVVGTAGLGATLLWQAAEDARDQVSEEKQRVEDARDLLEDEKQQTERALRKAETAEGEANKARILLAGALEREQEAKEHLDLLLYARRVSLAQTSLERGDRDQARRLLAECPPRRRGWEWHFVDRSCGSRGGLFAHTVGVTGVSFSPDGKEMASASDDRTVRVWDISTGRLARTLTGHLGNVTSVNYSRDGKRIVSGSGGDRTVKVWDSATGKLIRTFTGHTGPVLSVCFSPDGKSIASGSGDGTVKLWDLGTGLQTATCRDNGNPMSCVCFRPDGKQLVSASGDRTLKLWDVPEGRLVRNLTGHTEYVFSASFSPDGKRIASSSADMLVKVWDAETGQATLSLTGHTQAVRSVTFSPDGKRLASSGHDKTVKVWDVEAGRLIRSFSGHAGTVFAVSFSPDGSRIASASEDRTVHLWINAEDQPTITLAGHAGPVNCLSFAPDGTRLATGSHDRTVKVWDLTAGRLIRTLAGHQAAVRCICFSPNGKRLTSVADDGTVKVWDSGTGAVISTLAGQLGGIDCISISPDCTRLACSSQDMKVKVWDLETGRMVHSLAGHTGLVFSVCFSPDGKRLASASYDKNVRVWDTVTGQSTCTLVGHSDEIHGVGFTPDGTRLASGSHDRTVKLWDPTTGRVVFTLAGHTDSVADVCFSPDGKLLATASYDRSKRIWDANTGELMLTLSQSAGSGSLSFSPDGRRLAFGTGAEVTVWDAGRPFFKP